jgi:hypothetical protein
MKKEEEIISGEVYVVKKNGKYMTGHGYATGIGYNFTWSKYIIQAREMSYNLAERLANTSKGKVCIGDLSNKNFIEIKRLMTIEQIKDEYGKQLSDEQIQSILKVVHSPILQKKFKDAFEEFIIYGECEIKIDEDEFK